MGAAIAAFAAGLSRDVLLSYLPAFFAAGVVCIIASAAVLTIRSGQPKPSSRPRRNTRASGGGANGRLRPRRRQCAQRLPRRDHVSSSRAVRADATKGRPHAIAALGKASNFVSADGRKSTPG